MRSDEYNEEIWSRIDDDSVYPLEEYMLDPTIKTQHLPPSGSTTHFNIMTSQGSAMAVTNTVGSL